MNMGVAKQMEITVGATHASPLPNGWRWVRLGEVCEIIAGQSPPGSTYRTTPEGLPFFQGKADFGLLNPVARVWCIEPNKIALAGDILISVRAPVGPTNVADVKCCIGRGLAAIRCGGDVDSDFILSALRHFENKLVEKGSGSTFEAISRDDLEQLSIPIPPLSEQRRIAGILREQMATVEKARAAAQARLAAVKALPAAFLRQVFPQPGQPLPAGWRWVKLGEVFKLKSGEFLPASSMVESGAFPVYGGNGVTGWHNSYMFEESKIVIGRVGALCGCVQITRPQSWITDNALYVSNGIVPFDNDYMFQYLTDLDLNSLANQMGQPVIAGGVIYKQVIALPPIEEQRRIAELLCDQMAAVEKARAAEQEELNAINALPAALLRRAFNGEI